MVRTYPLPTQDDNDYFTDVTIREETLQRTRAEKTMDKIEEWVGRYKTLLDIGCGRGYLIEAAIRRGWKIFGLDINPYAIKATK